MKSMLSRVWLLGLPWLLLWTGAAQATPCQNNLLPSNPDSVYTDHGDSTVTDTRTGLMWKRCAEGLTGATCQIGSAQTFTWANALAHAEASPFANYSDWRLPSVRELRSLVEECRARPAINTNHFPNTPDTQIPESWFWSGSPTAVYLNMAWIVDFWVGFTFGGAGRSDFYHVRLVRGGK